MNGFGESKKCLTISVLTVEFKELNHLAKVLIEKIPIYRPLVIQAVRETDSTATPMDIDDDSKSSATFQRQHRETLEIIALKLYQTQPLSDNITRFEKAYGNFLSNCFKLLERSARFKGDYPTENGLSSNDKFILKMMMAAKQDLLKLYNFQDRQDGALGYFEDVIRQLPEKFRRSCNTHIQEACQNAMKHGYWPTWKPPLFP